MILRQNPTMQRNSSAVRKRSNKNATDVVILCAEEEVRDVIAYWLSTLPVRAFVAENGYQASEKLRDPACGLLITDRVLPPWPGLDVFIELRERNPNLQIAVVDNGSLNDQILASLTGANVLLPRPLTRQAVIDALARVESAA